MWSSKECVSSRVLKPSGQSASFDDLRLRVNGHSQGPVDTTQPTLALGSAMIDVLVFSLPLLVIGCLFRVARLRNSGDLPLDSRNPLERIGALRRNAARRAAYPILAIGLTTFLVGLLGLLIQRLSR